MAAGNWSWPITSVARTLYSDSGVQVPVVRLWAELAFSRKDQNRAYRNCLFDTGAAVSVMPLHAYQNANFAWQPLPGTWPPEMTTWMGVPCTVGYMDAWVPVRESPYIRGPFRFVAKFALAMPGHLPPNHPVLLGLNFLAELLGDTAFQCHSVPNAGFVTFP